MSNGINKRQNEEKSIVMLAAQRRLYNLAKKYDMLLLLVSVILPFACAILLCYFPNSIQLQIVQYLIVVGSIVFSFAIDGNIYEKKKLAALIQQKFDLYVYRMPWDNKLFGEEKEISHEIVVYSKKILTNDKEMANIVNWYRPEYDTKELLDGIALCQRENVLWDMELRKRYRTLSIITISGMIFIILIIALSKNESVYVFLSRMVFILPMLKWLLLNVITNINKNIKLQDHMEIAVRNKHTSMENLQFIQKDIYDFRKSCFIIPNWVYKLFKSTDEDNARRAASFEDM